MDLWLVAAATGAGYLAKYWQQLQSKEDSNELESCSSNSVFPRLGSSNLVQQTYPIDRSSSVDIAKDFPVGRREHMKHGIASTSDSSGEKHDLDNILSLPSLLGGLQGKETLPDDSSSYIHVSNRKKYLKYRSRRYLVRSVNSLESCLLAQLYREHAKMDYYIYNPVQSPATSTVRPFLVTDGKTIISRASQDYRGELLSEENEMRTEALRRRSRSSVQRAQSRGASSYSWRSSFQSQRSKNAMHLFLVGITIGMISATITKKRGTGMLKELLEQSHNLAHDFHEEHGMKDPVTTVELNFKDSEFTGENRIGFSDGEQVSFSDEQISDEELRDQKLEEYESMSKIEAELEAELERLELDNKTSSLENIFKMNPDNASEVMYGEPNLGNDRSHSDSTGTSGDQTHDPYYAVSPWELSLRLHEVIQSRLEAQIAELERALQNSQKRVHFLESEHMTFQRNEYSETDSRTRESPFLTEEDEHNVDEPLLLNLSGEALTAYNEAYEEILNITANDKAKSPIKIHNDDNLECDKMLFQGQSSRQDGSISQVDNSDERWFKITLPDKNLSSELWTSKSWRWDEFGESGR